KRIIDRGPFTSVEALESGLIDGICYAEDLREEYLGERKEISFRQYLSDTLLNDDWRPLPVLAVVVADGEITPEAGGVLPADPSNQVTPNVMRRAFARTGADADVKAVILRINSPGGSALASEDIYHAAMRLAEKKPLIVSMGNIAASGGYYVAMAADRLYANTSTVTGSIGIYGGKADLSGLYRKIALGKELYVRGKHAGMLSMSRPFTDDERAKFQSHLSAFYSHFLDLVAANRSLDRDSVDGLGRGRVWTGDDALSNGLVDDLGGLRQALDHAAAMLDLKEYRVRLYPEKRPLFVFPGRSMIRRFVSLLMGAPSEDVLPDLNSFLSEDGYLLARMPYDIEIE
ncbi:MAG: signal peptide peptidase SppA, partial [Candidatus Zixiibacteriota bacterium]